MGREVSEADERTLYGGGLRALYVAAQTVAMAAVAIGLTLYAGRRVGSPALLMVLFGAWVLAPFVVLVVGCIASKRWSVPMRLTLYAVVLVIAAASSMAYGYFALDAARPRTAAFVLTPPISILAAGVILAVTALVLRQTRN